MLVSARGKGARSCTEAKGNEIIGDLAREDVLSKFFFPLKERVLYDGASKERRGALYDFALEITWVIPRFCALGGPSQADVGGANSGDQ